MNNVVAEFRSFNRLYTRQIGLLDKHLLKSRFSLLEARVLYEVANGTVATAADLCRTLAVDKAQISRVVARLRAQGLVASRVSPDHAKHRLLSLTRSGRATFAVLDRDAAAQMERLLAPLDASSTKRAAEAVHQLQSILASRETASPTAFVLRPPRIGDLGWIVHRQALLYAREYDWDWTYEGFIAGIAGRFVTEFDSTKEAAWVADRDGSIIGSVFLMRGDDPRTGKLRLLYVEPSARGLGVGKALVARCIAQARRAGYRRLTLWTNDILIAARKIYQSAGFQLVAEEPHRSFGKELVGQTWTLDLTRERPPST
jgi:DNA-binding MarR family transcriptional regulator/GNAT superfamily N-acetyltransferase